MWVCKFGVVSVIFWFVPVVEVTSFNIPVPMNGPSNVLKNYSKLFQHLNVNNDMKSSRISTLRVLSHDYAPFMYQNRNKSFHNGIEFKLIQAIAEKERLDLLITETFGRHSPENFKRLLFKCVKFTANYLNSLKTLEISQFNRSISVKQIF